MTCIRQVDQMTLLIRDTKMVIAGEEKARPFSSEKARLEQLEISGPRIYKPRVSLNFRFRCLH